MVNVKSRREGATECAGSEGFEFEESKKTAGRHMRNQKEERYKYIYHKNAHGKHKTHRSVHLLSSLFTGSLRNIFIHVISILEEYQACSLASSFQCLHDGGLQLSSVWDPYTSMSEDLKQLPVIIY